MSPESPQLKLVRSVRAQELSSFVRSEIEQYQSGQVQSLTANQQLAEMFDYADKTSVIRALRIQGLVTLRRLVKPDFGGKDFDRAQALEIYTRDCVEKLRTGEEETLPSNADLVSKFGYERPSFYGILHRTGLTKERNIFREQLFSIPHNDNFAWLLGTLCGGGYSLSGGRGSVGLNRDDQSLQEMFKLVGEQLFEINVSYKKSQRHDGTVYKTPRFLDLDIAKTIGAVKTSTWPELIRKRYMWILENKGLASSFLSGLFDSRGFISTHPRRIVFSTTFWNVASFITDMLTNLGVNYPGVPAKGDKPYGVVVNNTRDIKFLSELIHSRLQEKEQLLDLYRRKNVRFKQRNNVESEEDVIAEWVRAKTYLEHLPSRRELVAMKRSGIVRFDPDVFVNRFGRVPNTATGKSFTKAIETMESIVFAREINAALRQYEARTNIRVKFTQKKHFPHDYNARDRLDELLSKKHIDKKDEVLLFSSSGQPLVTQKYE